MSRVELHQDGEHIATVDYETVEIHWTEALVDAGLMVSASGRQWGQAEPQADGWRVFRHVRAEGLSARVRD